MTNFLPNDPRSQILNEYRQIEEVYTKLENAYSTIKHRNAVSKGIFQVRDEFTMELQDNPSDEKIRKYVEMLEDTISDYGLSRKDYM